MASMQLKGFRQRTQKSSDAVGLREDFFLSLKKRAVRPCFSTLCGVLDSTGLRFQHIGRRRQEKNISIRHTGRIQLALENGALFRGTARGGKGENGRRPRWVSPMARHQPPKSDAFK